MTTTSAPVLTVGQKVTVTNDNLAYHAYHAGQVVTFVRVPSTDDWLSSSDSDALYFTSDDGVSQWLKPNHYTVNDARPDESLESFKALVVEKALDAAKRHGWCNEVKVVLRDLGLGTLIPERRTVELTYLVTIDAEPGEAEFRIQNRAINAVSMTRADGNTDAADFWLNDYKVRPLDS